MSQHGEPSEKTAPRELPPVTDTLNSPDQQQLLATNIPPATSISSPNGHATAGTTAPKAVHISDLAPTLPTGQRRRTSVSSSKRAGRSLARASPGGSTNLSPTPKKRKTPRFLAFLNCCGDGQDRDMNIGMDSYSNVPIRKERVVDVDQNRQPNLGRKQDLTPPESSAAESKDIINEQTAPASDNHAHVHSAIGSSSTEPRLDKPLPEVIPDAPTPPPKTEPMESPLVLPPVVQGSSTETPVSDAVYPDKSQVLPSATHTDPTQAEPIDDRSPIQATNDAALGDVATAASPEVDTSIMTQVPESGMPLVAPIAPLAAIAAARQAEAAAAPAKALLPPIRPEHAGRKCLVLDLDETLVHSSFKVMHQADLTVPVEIEGQYHNVYVIKRPGVDQFMKRVGELYEVVIFTASVSKYGDPLLDQLDIHNVVHHRLFRESCYNHQGNYVKDLSHIGRDLRNTIIIDNSPTSYLFHPQHAVPISSWFSDAHDNELIDLIPVLEDLATPQVADVSLVLDVAL